MEAMTKVPFALSEKFHEVFKVCNFLNADMKK